MAAKLFEARQEGTEQAIKKILVEASKLSESKFNQELIELKTKLKASHEKTEKLERTIQEQHTKIEQANVDQNLMSSKHEFDLKEKEKNLEVEFDKIKVMEKHLQEKHQMQVDAIKRESTYEMSKQCENLRLDYDRMKNEHHQLRQSMDTTIHTSIEEATRATRAEMASAYDTLNAVKMETDNKLMSAITERGKLPMLPRGTTRARLLSRPRGLAPRAWLPSRPRGKAPRPWLPSRPRRSAQRQNSPA